MTMPPDDPGDDNRRAQPRVLVTGAAGALGTAFLHAFSARGAPAIGLARQSVAGGAPGAWRTGDLLKPETLSDALEGVDVVVHCATKSQHIGEDVQAMTNLLAAGRRLSHLVYVGIAGIEDAAKVSPYYQAKLECEARLAASGVPHTIVRATQFHEFVDYLLRVSRHGPIQLLRVMRVQPVDTAYVAQRLADHAAARPQQRAADIHGPELLTARELFQQWQVARNAAVVAIPLPGVGQATMFGRLRAVHGDRGGPTWRAWLAGHP